MHRRDPSRSINIGALIAALLLLLLCGDRAHTEAALPIQSSTIALNIAIGVGVRCVVATTQVVFPPYLIGDINPVDAVGYVRVNCDAGRRASVRLDEGLNPEAGSTPRNPRRQMAGPMPGEYLRYNLYEDAARTRVWDDDRPGVRTARTWPVDLPVYARVPAGQIVTSGLYTDTVRVNVFY